MALDKLSKKILNNLKPKEPKLWKRVVAFFKRQNNAATLICSFSEELGYAYDILLADLAKKCHASEADMEAAVDYLVSQDYLAYQISGDLEIGFYLTYKGMRYKEFSRIEQGELFRLSVAYPCLVAFLTSLISPIIWDMLNSMYHLLCG